MSARNLLANDKVIKLWAGRAITVPYYTLTRLARLVNCYRCTFFQYWVENHRWYLIGERHLIDRAGEYALEKKTEEDGSEA